MRSLYFTFLMIMLMLLIFLVDWPEKVGDLVNKENLGALRDILKFDVAKIDSLVPDTLGAADTTEAWLSDGIWPPDTGWSDEPMPDLWPGSLLPELTEPASQAVSPVTQPPPEPAGFEFRDISEEPYLNESRKLLQDIRQNYQKITASPDTVGHERKRP